jgi:hypothetical protein
MKDEGRHAPRSPLAWLPQGRRRWVALGALALLLSLGALAALRQPAAARSGLADARRLWAVNGLAAYRLKIAQETRAGSCEQEMLVGDGKATPLVNTCGVPATWTVPRLFSWIEELEREEANCYPDATMCACRGTMSTVVTYDATLGYPREVAYEWRKRPNLLNTAYWRSLSDRSFPGCDKDGRGGLVTYTVTLTEEP